MSNCSTALSNPGAGDCKLQMDEIKRLMFVAYKKEDNSNNTISLTDAAAIANWQTRFNKWAYRDNTVDNDLLTKVVPTVTGYGFATELGDPEYFDENGYREKTAEGTYDAMMTFYNVLPQYIKKLKEFEGIDLAFWLVDDSNRVWGKLNGSNLDPIRIQEFDVSNFKPKERGSTSQEMIKMRLFDPKDMNELYSVEIADGDVTDDTDFYSLIDATATVTSPAVTGCQLVIATESFRGSTPVTGITYDKIVFRNRATPATTVSLAGAGSLTESPSGTYVVNEATLLTSGQVYDVEISLDEYDIVQGTFVGVP